MSDNLTELIDGPRQFLKDGVQLMNRCAKPDKREFIQVTQAVSIGFLIMGFIGFFVKLIHIPINNIIVAGFQCTRGRIGDLGQLGYLGEEQIDPTMLLAIARGADLQQTDTMHAMSLVDLMDLP
ncbi:hypothetical protein PhCBS80983_g00705 [Powellomyces hirtus]|uniref:Protein transport protein Sec61 subunit gamma n=1 Tax=Powellomyces hirtus TaxID=109895 RepID=A0A507EG24_9FUNG|nr:hypothetical protein DFJ77DRAFT_513117 [Powellomyces hirtus]TPX62138.1 hypothetical protein PhCBS80983_g00705 [Powellomyces hirtus]